MTTKCIVVGDFNINYERGFDDNYYNKNLFLDIDDVLSEFNLIQLVKFETWSRKVSTEKRSYILDHVYIKDPTVISKLNLLIHSLEIMCWWSLLLMLKNVKM